MKRLTGGKGVPVVYDSVGRDTFEQSLTCLAPRSCVPIKSRPAVALHCGAGLPGARSRCPRSTETGENIIFFVRTGHQAVDAM